VRQDRTKIEEQVRDRDETSNEAVFALIHTDRRHARTFTLSGWRRRPRNLIFLDGEGRQTALALGTPASTVIILLLVSIVSVPISAISPILTIAIIPVTISLALTVLLAISTISLALTVAAAAATRAAGAFSAWWG
jgi:hypothetical protein